MLDRSISSNIWGNFPPPPLPLSLLHCGEGSESGASRFRLGVFLTGGFRIGHKPNFRVLGLFWCRMLQSVRLPIPQAVQLHSTVTFCGCLLGCARLCECDIGDIVGSNGFRACRFSRLWEHVAAKQRGGKQCPDSRELRAVDNVEAVLKASLSSIRTRFCCFCSCERLLKCSCAGFRSESW